MRSKETINQNNEEELAEKAREKFVLEFHQGVNERLLEETDDQREENNDLHRKVIMAEKNANIDPLTGLLNGRGLEKSLAEARKKGMTGALLMVDVDRFKLFNDEHGHIVGNLALKAAANYLKSICRESDLVVRWGGEEFIIIFFNMTAEQVLKKLTPEGSDKAMININLKRRGEPGASNIEITFSGGVIDLGPYDDLDEKIDDADRALYDVKQNGRNEIKLAQEGSAAAKEKESDVTRK